jgi:hypothetical protein
LHSSVFGASFGLSSWCDELPIHQPTNIAGSHALIPLLLLLLLLDGGDDGDELGATERAGGVDTAGLLGFGALTLGTPGREKAGVDRKLLPEENERAPENPPEKPPPLA